MRIFSRRSTLDSPSTILVLGVVHYFGTVLSLGYASTGVQDLNIVLSLELKIRGRVQPAHSTQLSNIILCDSFKFDYNIILFQVSRTTPQTHFISDMVFINNAKPSGRSLIIPEDVIVKFKSALLKLESIVESTSFECAICLETIKDAHVVPECQHKFCERCIKDSIRKCGKECPECRTPIITQRHLRKDTKHDNLVSSFETNG